MAANEVLAWQSSVVALTFAVIVVAVLPRLCSRLGLGNPGAAKLKTYEYGIGRFDDATGPVSIRFD